MRPHKLFTAWCNALIIAVALVNLMGSRWAGVISRKGCVWDTDKARGTVANGASCLADTVAVEAVVAGHGTGAETRALVALTIHNVGSPDEDTRCEIALFRYRLHALGANALVSAICLRNLMGSGRTGVVGGKLVAWDTDVVRTRCPNGARGLTDAV